VTDAPRYTHILSDFGGVPAAQLRDATLLGGLLIAAAGAVGFAMTAPPTIVALPNEGIAGSILLDECHITLHTVPARELLLLDVLARSGQDAAKVVDVFARRLSPREVRTEARPRG
jgi:S-adenosylmethionine/arginine decarboxylase-like enzyme